MTSKADAAGSPTKLDRKARLAEELRANLARRKAQARSRRTGEADERPEGLAAAGVSAGVEGNETGADPGKDGR